MTEIPRVERGGAVAPIRLLGRGLSERSEFPSHLIRGGGGGTEGRARANMVLDTFAETRVSRRAAPKPRIK